MTAHKTSEDSLFELWALPHTQAIDEFAAEARLLIVDENSKLNINAITGSARQNNQTNPNSLVSPPDFWANVLLSIFTSAGFQSDSFSDEEFRTLGNRTYDPETQIAVIRDWMDTDTRSAFSIGGGEGIESSSPKEWFYNRRMHHLSELLLVPGITMGNFSSIATMLRADFNNIDNRMNINTIPVDVLPIILDPMGFNANDIEGIIQTRAEGPIDGSTLSIITQAIPAAKR